MKVLKFIIISAVSASLFINCTASRSLTDSQSSVVIHLKDGSKKEGLVIKRNGEFLEYMDSNSHNKESVSISNISRLNRASVVYDFEANPIPQYSINEEKGMSNTLLYGGGGLILGSAAGVGLGIALVAGGVNLNPYVSIAVLGITGAVYFGFIGSESDYEDAVFEVRKKRYAVSKQKREAAIKEEKEKIEQSKKEKEQLQKKLKDKKNN